MFKRNKAASRLTVTFILNTRLWHVMRRQTATSNLLWNYCSRYKRQSLKILGSVGEPINPEAWLWYHNVVGDGRCAIVDTFWQTETVRPPHDVFYRIQLLVTSYLAT